MYRDRRDVGLTLAGVVASMVGAFFPLFQPNPRYMGDVPDGFVMELSSGIRGGFDGVLLALAGGIVVLLAFGQGHRLRAVASVVAGLLAVGVPARHLLTPTASSLTLPFDASAPFVPALGWYAMVVGGLLLVVAGGRRLVGRA